MPITINYNPAAAAVGSAALVGGEGDYLRWLNQFKQNQYQFAVGTQMQQAQMQLQRQNALSQIAATAQNEQNQRMFQMQMAPQQAALQQQGQAFQSALGTQSNNQQQMLGASIDNQQAADQFAYKQQLSEQAAQQQADVQSAQQQAELERQTGLSQFNADLKEHQVWQQNWSNPFAASQKSVDQATQQGYQFNPADDQKRKGLINDIQAIQQQVSGGDVTYGDALPAFKQKYSQLNSIVPTDKPPTLAEFLAQNVHMGVPTGNKNPDGTPEIVPGTEQFPFSKNNKTGEPIVVRGFKADDGSDPNSDPLKMAKTEGQQFKNSIAAHEHVDKAVNEYAKANQVRQYNADWPQELAAERARQYAMIGVTPPNPNIPPSAAQIQPSQVVPQQQPGQPPAAQTEQAPQQPQGPVAQQQPPQPAPQQAASPQAMPIDQAYQVADRLKQTPRDQWTVNDKVLLRNALLAIRASQTELVAQQ